MCVRLLQLNPGRDAGIKPRVSPRTRGQQLSEALRTLDEGGAGDHDPESLCRHNPRPHRSLPDFANQGRHPLRGLVLLHTPIHGFADSPVAKCLHPFQGWTGAWLNASTLFRVWTGAWLNASTLSGLDRRW